MKTQKTHCKYASKRECKDMACYIRHKEGDERVESGEFAETQVQRPPEQKSRIPRTHRANDPSSRKAQVFTWVYGRSYPNRHA